MTGQRGREPSMEDILASIRVIINRADGEPAPEAVPSPDEPEPDEPVAPTVAAASAPESAPAQPAPIQFGATSVEPVFVTPTATIAMRAPQPAPLPVQPAPPADDVLELNEPAPATTAAPASAAAAPFDMRGPSLEDTVREMLAPMLKQWLDANLQTIVEDVAIREVRRLTGRE